MEESEAKPTPKEFVGNKLLYENATVFTIRENGHWQPLVDIRGFGAIQNLFKDKSGAVDLIAANNYQDSVGEYIKEAINNYESLKAENAKLQESNNQMAELLKEELQAYREIVSKGDGHKFEVNVYDCETQILEIERVLTENIKDMKEKVLAYLKSQNTGKRPTDIGLALGKDYNTASSSVSPALKQLTKDGIIKRQKVEGKITYQYKR